MPETQKVIVILGPTAIGKTSLSIELCKKFSGEVISADSRQVYKGLNVSSGKITPKEAQGVSHHLIDILHLGKNYNAYQFRVDALTVLDEIKHRSNVPFIVGGAGFFIASLVYNWQFPTGKNSDVRAAFENLKNEQLWDELQRRAPERASELVEEKNNRHRLLRALELSATGVAILPLQNRGHDHLQFLQIGLTMPREKLKARIKLRTQMRIEAGFLGEIASILGSGVSKKVLQDLGFEYRLAIECLEGKISTPELAEKIAIKDSQYAKRQMTWFKRFNDIQWFEPDRKEEIFTLVGRFLSV